MPAYSARYNAALGLAASAHRSQSRKGSGIPYFTHPVHVSVILLRSGFSEEVAIAGLLHDIVEDQDVPLARIEADFGPIVAEMVAALSERKQENGVKRPWEARKQEALDQLRGASAEAVAVKAADVLHNARSLAEHLVDKGAAAWDDYSRGPQQSLWYYRSVAALVRERLGMHALVGELEAAIEHVAQTMASVARA